MFFRCFRLLRSSEEGFPQANEKPLLWHRRCWRFGRDVGRLGFGWRNRYGWHELADSRLLYAFLVLFRLLVQRFGNILVARLNQFVTEFGDIFHLVAANSLDLEMRMIHAWRRQQQHPNAGTAFDRRDVDPLLIQQVGRHRDWKLRFDPSRLFLHRFFFDQPQHGERGGVDGADLALAFAARTFALRVIH